MHNAIMSNDIILILFPLIAFLYVLIVRMGKKNQSI